MAAEVETLPSQELSLVPDVEAKCFYFKFIRYDEAWVACFVPDCETPIKYGWSDIDIKTGRPAGYIVKSVLLEDQISYRPASANGYSHFSAQSRMVVDVGSIENGEAILKLFEKVGSRVKLDLRDKNRVRVNVGACRIHKECLDDLNTLTDCHGGIINLELLTQAIEIQANF